MYTFVSWNVRYFAHATRGITSTERTLRGIADALVTLQPDVIALQEIDDYSVRSSIGRARRRLRAGVPLSQLDRFMACLNDRSLAAGGHLYQAQFYPAQGHSRRLPLYSTGLAIVYRNTLEQVDHNGASPADITHRRIRQLARLKQKRICAWSRFRAETGQEFDLFNTHLSLPAFFKRPRNQTGKRFGEGSNQLREIDNVLAYAHEMGEQNTTILAGDFNATPGSQVYNRIVQSGHLRDAHAAHLGMEPQELAGMASAGFLNLRYRLDHIFSGPEVQFESFEDTQPYGRRHPLRRLSDHSPLVCRFTLPAAEMESRSDIK